MASDNMSDLAKMVLCAFLGFAAVADAVVAVFFYVRSKNKYENYLKTEGVVSGVKFENGSRGKLVYPILKFQLGGKEYETRNQYGKSPWNIQRGTEVDIVYDMDDPNRAEIENKLLQFLLPIMAAAGAVMAFAAAVVVWFFVPM